MLRAKDCVSVQECDKTLLQCGILKQKFPESKAIDRRIAQVKIKRSDLASGKEPFRYSWDVERELISIRDLGSY